MEQDNRESWLNRMATGMAPLFEALDAPLRRDDAAEEAGGAPAQVRVRGVRLYGADRAQMA